MNIPHIDAKLIKFFQKIAVPMARISLFVIFAWFGALKVFGLSPASELVQELFARTIPFMSFDVFIILFGAFEVLIGILFIIPKAERVVIPLLGIHMITTLMPLIMLPQVTWSGFFVPTMEGQYIIKNLALITCAIVISANLQPLSRRYLDVGPISSFR